MDLERFSHVGSLRQIQSHVVVEHPGIVDDQVQPGWADDALNLSLDRHSDVLMWTDGFELKILPPP